MLKWLSDFPEVRVNIKRLLPLDTISFFPCHCEKGTAIPERKKKSFFSFKEGSGVEQRCLQGLGLQKEEGRERKECFKKRQLGFFHRAPHRPLQREIGRWGAGGWRKEMSLRRNGGRGQGQVQPAEGGQISSRMQTSTSHLGTQRGKGQPEWRSAEERREGRGRVSSKCNPGTEMDKQRDLGPPRGQKAWPGNLLTVARLRQRTANPLSLA